MKKITLEELNKVIDGWPEERQAKALSNAIKSARSFLVLHDDQLSSDDNADALVFTEVMELALVESLQEKGIKV